MKKRKLKEIANIYNGNSINAKTKADKYCFNVPGWNYIGTKDIDFDGTVNYDTGVKIPFEEKGFKIAPANCVFVCSEGGSAGKKTAHITHEVCFGNKLYAIVNDKNLFVSKYVYYYTRYREFFEQFKALMSGIIGGVSSKKFGEIEIPLPSLQEQQLIVSKIEELFSKLDKGVEELEATKKEVNSYRFALIQKLIPKCANKKISDCIIEMGQGWSPKCEKDNTIDNNKWAVIKTSAIQPFNFIYEENKLLPVHLLPREKHELEIGDVLITRAGPKNRCGVCCMVRKTKSKLLNCDKVYRIKVNTEIIMPEYLECVLNSPEFIKEINLCKTGGNDSGLNLTQERFLTIQIPVPELEIQRKLINEIEAHLSVCDKIEQIVNESLQKAESLRQSILKQAFEGKLV